MKITKELLERYELGQCTDQEEAAVSKWLDSPDLVLDELEGELDLGTTKEHAIKQDLWENIAAHMDASTPTERHSDLHYNQVSKDAFLKSRRTTVTWLSVAASTIILLGIGWWGFQSSNKERQFFNANNSDNSVVLWEEDSFEFTLSKNSSASINFQSGNMAVSGDVLFSPKRDIILYDEQNKTSLDFRQGEVYFISTDPDTSELVVYSKKELEYLPPILRKHIRKQFHLT
ncbi:hypothetical protein M8998_02700 [Sphingobacterium sp. lm-10]|uniref:hypothetical protein n=1 Tax=Sphingobacterium sp. lm-10 TaxID=2944904 RepID=UPI0020200575|nr:hypothetical protein [Sphingobacterium sp. lm-10]MCL7986844.1 hypothetical protein [Sphingobacterium sp. lm-10]